MHKAMEQTGAEQLPVNQRRDEIARTIADHPVVVLCGETGSGKTTQLPQICLALGRGRNGLIGHTQPRRIAARSVAARIAEELGRPDWVGYKVRFNDRTGPQSRIKVMTDGILLAEIEHDRELHQYDTLIIDEAHERSLNIDFLLGYLKQLLPRRPDLKLIITSATIDPQRFSRHFDGAPVIEVSGRTWPVELRYRPLHSDDPDEADRDLQQGILDAVDELAACGPGDVLVFLPGEREIREAAERLRKHHPPQTEILPLYARLTAQEQQRVFRGHPGRRIVLATNVAETSLTVPGIRYVVDTGLARISRYSVRAKVQRLPVEKVSQASAEQRKGRCGRVAAGVCIRLYDEDDFNARPAFTDPEIARTHLAAVILRMESLGLGAVDAFPFVEPPDGRLVSDGYRLLHELGAVDGQRRLTPLGRRLARFPLDPRLARMVLAGAEEQALDEVLVIASLLGSQDPRERPHDQREKADEAHRRWHREPQVEGEPAPPPAPPSDFLAVLRLWHTFHEQRRHLSQNKLRRWCRDHFLSWLRMREWIEVHSQLKGQAGDAGLFRRAPRAEGASGVQASYEAIHRAVLSGLLGQIGLRIEQEERPAKGAREATPRRKGRRQVEYLGARGCRFALFPGSAAQKSPPKWLLAAELVETSRLFARHVAVIQPEWVERLAGHLIKRSYSEPHWERRAGRVAAYETVTLYGLPLATRRKIHYGPIAPDEARELFIRHALVAGELNTRAAFFHHNREQVAEIEALEARGRRRDLLVDDEALFAFYDTRISAGIHNAATFERWRKQVERDDPNRLFLSREQLLRGDDGAVAADAFPDSLALGAVRLPLHYRFEPGEADDGVTALVPLPALGQIDPTRCAWLVPGLRQELFAALLRGLPKALRRNFVPVPEFARLLAESVGPEEGPLPQVLSRRLHRVTGVEVPEAAWSFETLPDHLRMHFRVLDGGGATLAEGRDLVRLQRQLHEAAGASFSEPGGSAPEAETAYERGGLSAWTVGTLPESIETERHGVALRGYPALVDEGESVALRLLDTPARAATAHRAGLCRLFALVANDRVRYLRRHLPGLNAMCLHYATLGKCETLREALVKATIERALLGDGEAPRDAEGFEHACARARQELLSEAERLCATVAETLALRHAIERRLKRALSPVWLEALHDVRGQLDRLLPADFLATTPAEWLPHLPRYLKAIELRLDKLERDPARDRRLRLEVAPLDSEWPARLARQRQEGRVDPELMHYRWLVEEFRVSLFAQELKTVAPVSAKRLKTLWQSLG